MQRHVRIRLLVLGAIAVISAAVWVAGERQRSAANLAFAELDSAQSMLVAMLDQESGLAGYANTGRESFRHRYEAGERDLELALIEARQGVQDGEEDEVEAIQGQIHASQEFNSIADPLIADVQVNGPRSVPDRTTTALDADLERFRDLNGELQADRREERDVNQDRAGLLTVLLIVALSAGIGGGGYLLFERRSRRDGRRISAHAKFVEVLQLSRTESEAHQIVKRHLERLVDGGRATVLNRNNSANRLEASTTVEGDRLCEALDGAEPEDCLAIRGGKPHSQDADGQGLMTCEICGATGADVTCVPSLVGGEVIGSVLVEHRKPLPGADVAYLSSSVAEASPILANLRNLAIAELRAATDALTGIPNNRALQETLKRMTAQSARTGSPLAVVLFDLDHFKRINDTYGHGKGDEVLAAVGDAAGSAVRASDVVGRYGGEEFLALLPDTEREGAAQAAETLRAAIDAIEVPGVAGNVTASFGVAVLPDDAGEPEMLLRVADRALYMAKARGRNRVELGAATENGRATATI